LTRKAVAASTLPLMLVLSLAIIQAPQSYAQTQAQPETTKIAALREPAATPDVSPTRPATAPDPVTVDIQKELAAMKVRIELLEAELKSRTVTTNASLVPVVPAKTSPLSIAAPVGAAQASGDSSAAKSGKPGPTVPFAYADWTWLNGNPRNKDAVWDSKFFTPEVRFDTDYIYDFNHPRDDTLGGSTEIFRSNEVQLEQLSFGGDLHWENVRGRILTMNGMFSVTT